MLLNKFRSFNRQFNLEQVRSHEWIISQGSWDSCSYLPTDHSFSFTIEFLQLFFSNGRSGRSVSQVAACLLPSLISSLTIYFSPHIFLSFHRLFMFPHFNLMSGRVKVWGELQFARQFAIAREFCGYRSNCLLKERPVVQTCSGLLGSRLQSWSKKCVLGCVNSPLRQQAESRNLGQTFLANSVNWRRHLRRGPGQVSNIFPRSQDLLHDTMTKANGWRI